MSTIEPSSQETEYYNTEILPINWFTYCFITGDYDRNKGVWFGLMRLMKHPQKWANKLFSSIIHQVATGASGGVLAEEGAISNLEEFRKTYARSDAITEVAAGALEGNQIQTKEHAPYPQGLEQMMEIAVTAIRGHSWYIPRVPRASRSSSGRSARTLSDSTSVRDVGYVF